MSIFGNLGTEGLEKTEDRLGGFQPHTSDIYESTIKLAYAGESAKGARFVSLVVEAGGRDYRETVYITNQKGENFFLNKNDRTKKVPLPGFTTINDLCLATTEKPLAAQETEEKVVKVWDPATSSEQPKSVPVLTELLGQKVGLGIIQSLENKNEKNAAGDYVATPETRTTNSIDKVFHLPSKMTIVEATNGATEPAFYDAWLEKNRDQVRDRRELKDGAGNAGRPGGPPAGGNAGAPATKSLFNK